MAFENAAASVEKKATANSIDLKRRFREIEENRLATAVRRGEQAAFHDLWRLHAAQILRIAYRITRNREDAEDALQDAFLRAFVHIQDFDGRSRFSTWLIRIAINSALMIVRKRESAIELSMDDAGDEGRGSRFKNMADRAPNPEAHYAGCERDEILRNAVSALRPTIRQAIELQKLQERSIEETAAILGLSIAAAKSRLYHGKAQLRESLTPAVARQRRGTASRYELGPAA